jgi:paired small multidrug resistance pump
MKLNGNWAWFVLLIAAGFEVGWVVGLKYASTWIETLVTIFAIFISFVLLIWTAGRLAVGTAYAVFVGLGTAGTALVDVFIFSEPINWHTLVFITTLLIGVIGLKLTTKTSTGERGME